MRKTALVFNRFLSLFLSFLLGFFSFGGLLVGAGYIAYNHLSVDFLTKFGITVDTDAYFDKNAEVSIDALTLKELIAEIEEVSALGDEVTFDFLRERYGLKLGEEFESLLPEGVRTIPLTTLFGDNGLNAVLEAVKVSYVLQFVPADMFSDPMVYSIQDKTLAEVVEMNLGYLFEDVELGYLLGLEYVKNADGEYELVVQDPSALTIQEIIAPINLGSVLADAQAGELDILEVLDNNLTDVTVSAIVKSLEAVEIPTAFGNKTLGEIIELGEDGVYFIAADKLTDGVFLGDVIGFYCEEGVWYEDDGKVGDERTTAGALFEPICSVPLIDLIDPAPGKNTTDVIMDSFRTSDTKLGDVMGYYLDNGVWYLDDGAVGEARVEADAFFAPICNVGIADILSPSADKSASDIIMEQFELCGTKLGDIMGYVYDTSDNKWYLDNGATGDARVEADALFAPLCDIMLYELINHPENKPAGEVFKDKFEDSDTRLGDLMGYTKVPNPDYDPLGGTNDYLWFDGEEEITGVGATVAEYSVTDLLEGKINTDDIVNNLTLAEVYGFYKVEGIPVYINGSNVDISDKVDVSLWYNDKGEKANSIISALAHLKVSELSGKLNELTIANAIGLIEYDDNLSDSIGPKYYSYEVIEGADGKYIVLTADESITSEFAGLDLNGLSNGNLEKRIEEIPIGKFLGYTQAANGEWLDGGSPVDGILGIVAGATTKTLENKINKTTIGDLAGYIYIDAEGSSPAGWYVEYNSPSDNIPATGLLASLADLTVTDLSNEDVLRTKVQTIKICDVLGYTYDPVREVYTKTVNGKTVVVDGVMGHIAGATVGNVEDEINNTPISTIAGFYFNEADGKWYTDKELQNEAHGVLVSFADLTIGHITDDGEMSHRIQSITIADAFEYQQDPATGKWHYTLDDGTRGETVKGIMGVIADSKISDISNKINNTTTGDLLGYTYGQKIDKDGNVISDEYCWYDESGVEVHPLMNKVSSMQFSELHSMTDSLTIGDIIRPEDRESGYLSLIDPRTTLNNLPRALNDIFDTMTIKQLHEAGVIKLADGVALNDSISDFTINELIHYSIIKTN